MTILDLLDLHRLKGKREIKNRDETIKTKPEFSCTAIADSFGIKNVDPLRWPTDARKYEQTRIMLNDAKYILGTTGFEFLGKLLHGAWKKGDNADSLLRHPWLEAVPKDCKASRNNFNKDRQMRRGL